MIKSRHHPLLYPFFEWYGLLLIKLHFRSISIKGNYSKNDLPVLIISNHFSWWDGFFVSTFNIKKIHKKFHVMMLENQLSRCWFFRHSGAYSIRKKSKSIIDSLNYTVELLQKPQNMVALFPQGQFESVYTQPLKFQRGISWILKNLKNDVQLLFVANLTEYFESVRPRLFIYFKEYDYKNKTQTDIENDYNKFYRESYLDKLNLAQSQP